MNAEAVGTFLAGILQPFVQEIITRGQFSGRIAQAITVGVSVVLALVAVYVTGGFAGGSFPGFDLANPAPFFGFVVGKTAPVYALSQITYSLAGGNVQKIAKTSP